MSFEIRELVAYIDINGDGKPHLCYIENIDNNYAEVTFFDNGEKLKVRLENLYPVKKKGKVQELDFVLINAGGDYYSELVGYYTLGIVTSVIDTNKDKQTFAVAVYTGKVMRGELLSRTALSPRTLDERLHAYIYNKYGFIDTNWLAKNDIFIIAAYVNGSQYSYSSPAEIELPIKAKSYAIYMPPPPLYSKPELCYIMDIYKVHELGIAVIKRLKVTEEGEIRVLEAIVTGVEFLRPLKKSLPVEPGDFILINGADSAFKSEGILGLSFGLVTNVAYNIVYMITHQDNIKPGFPSWNVPSPVTIDYSKKYFLDSKWVKKCRYISIKTDKEEDFLLSLPKIFEKYKFGIELEGIVDCSPEDLGRLMEDAGIDVEVDRNTTTSYIDCWKITSDSSISVDFDGDIDEELFGVEIVSPPLRGAEGVKQLKKVYDILYKCDWHEDDSCGMHIHVDGSNFTTSVNNFSNLIRLMFLAEPDLIRMQKRNRSGKRYCRPMHSRLVQDVGLLSENTSKSLFNSDIVKCAYYGTYEEDTGFKYHDARYRGLNLHSYWYRGTIEFRYFCTPVKFETCVAYIDLVLNMVDTALCHPNLIKEYYEKRMVDYENNNKNLLIKLFLDEQFRELFREELRDYDLNNFEFTGHRKALLEYLKNAIVNDYIHLTA